jgi:hypothetical protein
VNVREFIGTQLRGACLALESRLPDRWTSTASTVQGWLEIGRWMRQQSYHPLQTFRDRYGIFDLIGREISYKQVLYLEFGVYKGESMRYWSKLLKNPESILYGFDSFEGLPEIWQGRFPTGHFSTSGRIPDVPDTRVQFFKGWFKDTLPLLRLPPHDVLVLNMDADLYSSTKLVLDRIGGSLAVGDWLYFDEFTESENEFRAFREFVEQTGMHFTAVAESGHLKHTCFRVLGL